MRARLSEILLILAIVGLAINLGGTFYQMVVIYPEWSGQLPESLVTFFGGGRWFAAQGRFWQHPVTDLGLPIFIAALVVSWPYKQRRNWMLLAVLVLVPIILSTALYFIPNALGLMRDAGASMSPADITARAQAWLFWDKVRFAGILLVFVATLLALSATPVPRAISEDRSS